MQSIQDSRQTLRPKPLQVLMVTTKCPWPAVDGGRLLVAKTLSALDPSLVRVTLVGPWTTEESKAALTEGVPSAVASLDSAGNHASLSSPIRRHFGRPLRLAATTALASIGFNARPATAIKHSYPYLKQRVQSLLNQQRFDVIHVEQPHALDSVPATSIPIVLRAQNVEADLWQRYADAVRGLRGRLLSRQASVVSEWEHQACVRANRVVAISEDDRGRFHQRYPGLSEATLAVVPPAFSPIVATAEGSAPNRPEGGFGRPQSLEGAPSVVLFCGSGWRPNRLGESHFLRRIWPQMLRRESGAVLHAFSSTPLHHATESEFVSVKQHAAPSHSDKALVPGSVLAVPATVTSGVRMKILEAVARGLCVITSEAGARGLGPEMRNAVLVADRPSAWVDHLARCAQPHFFSDTVKRARRALVTEHHPPDVASALVRLYSQAKDSVANAAL